MSALLLPSSVFFDSWFSLAPLGAPEAAILVAAVLHLAAYLGLIWLIGRAGPVFASQVGYVTTGSGVFLGMLLYGEHHSL